MAEDAENGTLIALDAGVRVTGWEVFSNGQIEGLGTIKLRARQCIDVSAGVAHLVECLNDLMARWNPDVAACSQLTGIGRKVPARNCWILPLRSARRDIGWVSTLTRQRRSGLLWRDIPTRLGEIWDMR